MYDTICFGQLKLTNEDRVFIIYNQGLDNYGFSNLIMNNYPFVHLIKIADTRGAVETLFLGIEQILNNYTYHNKCLILDCNTFYTEDIACVFKSSTDNMVFYTKNYDKDHVYSHIKLNEESIITDIQEKQKISDNANTGAVKNATEARVEIITMVVQWTADGAAHFVRDDLPLMI